MDTLSSASLGVLVVDVSEDWEEVIKAHERGYMIEWEHAAPGRYVQSSLDWMQRVPLDLVYPHGSVRAGLNAIIDTVRLAWTYFLPIFSVHTYDEWSDGDEVACFSLQPYIHEQNQFYKGGLSAFIDSNRNNGKGFVRRITQEQIKHLLIIGYDRDYCVRQTVADALERGFEVTVSEHCMLTKDDPGMQEDSLAYFRKNTHFQETLVDVWNFLGKHRLSKAA